MKRRTIVQPGDYTIKSYNKGVYQVEGEGIIQDIPRYKLLPKKD